MGPRTRSRRGKNRRWRVSVYVPGVTDPSAFPDRHHACRSLDTAQAHYDLYRAQIGKGKIGRVILHQGLLYRGYSAYIHEDSDWDKPRIAA